MERTWIGLCANKRPREAQALAPVRLERGGRVSVHRRRRLARLSFRTADDCARHPLAGVAAAQLRAVRVVVLVQLQTRTSLGSLSLLSALFKCSQTALPFYSSLLESRWRQCSAAPACTSLMKTQLRVREGRHLSGQVGLLAGVVGRAVVSVVPGLVGVDAKRLTLEAIVSVSLFA